MALLSRSIELLQSLKSSAKPEPGHPDPSTAPPQTIPAAFGEWRQLREASGSLTHSTDALTHFVKHTLENMETVSVSIHQIVHAATLQSEETEKSLADSEALGLVLEQSAEQIRRLEAAVTDSRQAAGTGKTAVEQLGSQAVKNDELSRHLQSTMAELQQHSTEISQALGLIFGISQSIQMLSLNASIEAARAGEHGRGFAVVAQEVRRLAQESAEGGEQIRKVLQALRQQIDRFHDVVNETRHSSQHVTLAVGNTTKQFGLILDNLASVDAYSGAIRELLGQAGENKRVLTQNLHTVTALAQQSLASACEVADRVEHQASAVLSLAAAAQDLQSATNEIKASVARIAGDGSAENGSRKLRIGFIPNVSHAPALLAIHNETFERKFPGQVEVRAFSAGPALVDAIVSGRIDVGYTGPGPVFEAFSKQGDVQILSGVNEGGAALLVRANSPATDFAQLRKATIAIPQYGNGQHILLRQLLRQHQMKDVYRGGDIRIVQAKPSALLELFAQGSIDAALVQEPWVTLLEAKGAARILLDWNELYDEGRYPNTVIAVNGSYYQENRETIEAFLRIHQEAVQTIRAGSPAAFESLAEALRRWTGQSLSLEATRAAMNRIAWSADPRQTHMRNFARLIREEGFLQTDISFQALLADGSGHQDKEDAGAGLLD